MHSIVVMQRHNYGRVVYDPKSPAALILAQLTGTKTLTFQHLKLAKDMGATVVIEQIQTEIL